MSFLSIAGLAAEPARSIADMRELSPGELAGRPAIDVEAIALTIVSADGGEMVVWQDGVAMYLSTRRAGGDSRKILPESPIKPGDRLRVRGTVWESFIAPIIVPNRIERLGSGDLPDAVPTNWVEMRSGQLASQWVRVNGVVQAVRPFSSDGET